MTSLITFSNFDVVNFFFLIILIYHSKNFGKIYYIFIHFDELRKNYVHLIFCVILNIMHSRIYIYLLYIYIYIIFLMNMCIDVSIKNTQKTKIVNK